MMESNKIIDILKPIDYNDNIEKYRKLSIVVVSDTHNKHDMINIPDGDIFLHCGDFTNRYEWQNLSDEEVPKSIINFNQWLGNLPHRYKIVICGNHDINFGKISKENIKKKYLTNCIYLHDELIEIEGISIYGCSWAFNKQHEIKWPLIPSHIDILMTHIPPQFILDLAFQPKNSPSIEPCLMCNNSVHGSYGHWGSKSLIKQIHERIQPRVHCFGHVHDDSGYKYYSNQYETLFINASADLTNQSYKFNFYVDLSNKISNVF